MANLNLYPRVDSDVFRTRQEKSGKLFWNLPREGKNYPWTTEQEAIFYAKTYLEEQEIGRFFAEFAEENGLGLTSK